VGFVDNNIYYGTESAGLSIDSFLTFITGFGICWWSWGRTWWGMTPSATPLMVVMPVIKLILFFWVRNIVVYLTAMTIASPLIQFIA
jgi:hypothetical protein